MRSNMQCSCVVQSSSVPKRLSSPGVSLDEEECVSPSAAEHHPSQASLRQRWSPERRKRDKLARVM